MFLSQLKSPSSFSPHSFFPLFIYIFGGVAVSHVALASFELPMYLRMTSNF